LSNKFLVEQLGESAITEILAILKNNLAQDRDIFVYGSRVKNRHKLASDLDLAILPHSHSVSLLELASLNMAFEESDLPIRVDLIDLSQVDKAFLDLIVKEMVEIRL